MAAPIGYQRRGIEGLLDGEEPISWPELTQETRFFDGDSSLYLLGISERDTHSLPDHRHCVAVFVDTPVPDPRPFRQIHNHFCSASVSHACSFAVRSRRATSEEARSAGVDEKTAQTIELLRFSALVGTIVRLVPTGKIATYARV